MVADGGFEGGVVAFCLFSAPDLLGFSAFPFGGLKVCGEPGGFLVGAGVGGFSKWSEGVGAVVKSLLEVEASFQLVVEMGVKRMLDPGQLNISEN
ncbi:hypothetical protein NDU88_005941 [Pleurodeles waltl]|uniref:Uncharacterized protein n=1 Tax=Pleurodeles waltl TaxID=8319 RepID=A0AAV7LMU8_PLEWA|nr:hypothetical protein NDU88_005941 [Pleurodeles waltl]